MNQIAQAYHQIKSQETDINIISVSVSYNNRGFVCVIEFVHKNYPETKLSVNGWDNKFEKIAINSAKSKVYDYVKQIIRKSIK